MTCSGRHVLDGVSFAAASGEIVAVVGPNGAGKTTLLEAIVGLVPSTTRLLTARGTAIPSFAQRAQTFAYMPDEARLPEEVTVRTLLPADLALSIRCSSTACSAWFATARAWAPRSS